MSCYRKNMIQSCNLDSLYLNTQDGEITSLCSDRDPNFYCTVYWAALEIINGRPLSGPYIGRLDSRDLGAFRTHAFWADGRPAALECFSGPQSTPVFAEILQFGMILHDLFEKPSVLRIEPVLGATIVFRFLIWRTAEALSAGHSSSCESVEGRCLRTK